jgi:hypothetical protein
VHHSILELNSDISLDYKGAADKNRLACDNFVIQRDVGVLAGTEFNAEERLRTGFSYHPHCCPLSGRTTSKIQSAQRDRWQSYSGCCRHSSRSGSIDHVILAPRGRTVACDQASFDMESKLAEGMTQLASTPIVFQDGVMGKSAKRKNRTKERSPIHAVKPTDRPSRSVAEDAVRTLIRWSGDDPEREGLLGTPARVVRAYEDRFRAILKIRANI